MKRKITLIFALALFGLFIAGCNEPTCNKPYIKMGTSCCLDQNSNAICDTDEVVKPLPNITSVNEKISEEKNTTSTTTQEEVFCESNKTKDNSIYGQLFEMNYKICLKEGEFATEILSTQEYNGGVLKIMTINDTTTINVDGKQAVVSIVSIDTNTGTSMITVNGESKLIMQGQTQTIGGVRVYVNLIYSYTVPVKQGAIILFIGSDNQDELMKKVATDYNNEVVDKEIKAMKDTGKKQVYVYSMTSVNGKIYAERTEGIKPAWFESTINLGTSNSQVSTTPATTTITTKELTEAEKIRANSIIETSMAQGRDEFAQATWYRYDFPSTTPNGEKIMQLYFWKYDSSSTLSSLGLQIDYHASSWLFINKYKFNIDGEYVDYVPNKVFREVLYGANIREQSSQEINAQSCELIKKIINSKETQIRFNGDEFYDTKTIDPLQKHAMKVTLFAYLGLGGSLPECLKNLDFSDLDSNKKECITNAECGSKTCLNNKCVECVGNSDCSSLNPVCSNNKCVKCSQNSDCPTDEYQECSVCQTARHQVCSNNACVICMTDSDCVQFGPSYSKKCKKSNVADKFNMCVDCLSDSDCGGNSPFCGTHGFCSFDKV